MKPAETQTPTLEDFDPLLIDGRKMEGHNGNGIFDIPMLTDFIHQISKHSAECSCPMDIICFNNQQGAHICETWQCPRCRKCLELNSSKMITTPVVEPGRKYARPQPDINMRIAKASRDHGVGITDKTIGFLSESLGIKISDKRNLLHQHGKVKAAITNVFEERKDENMKEHVAAVRSSENYEGDLEWEDATGEKHSTSQGGGAIDGHGLKRSYMNNHTGSQSSAQCSSSVTKKPLALVHNQVCQLASFRF